MAETKPDTIESLKAEVTTLQTDKEALLTTNEALVQKVEELEKQNQKLAAADGSIVVDEAPVKHELPTEVFEVDKVKYVFTVAIFRHNNAVITAAAALGSKEILADLVKVGSGVIKRKGE